MVYQKFCKWLVNLMGSCLEETWMLKERHGEIYWIMQTVKSYIIVSYICADKPSYPNGSSFLDHFLVSPHLIDSSSQNLRVTTLPSFSDHSPIKLELIFRRSDLVLRNIRFFTSYKNTNWNSFCYDLESACMDIIPSKYRNLQNN